MRIEQRPMSHVRTCFALIAAFATATPSVVLAAEPSKASSSTEAREARQQAEQAFVEGRYDDAAEAFQRAHDTSPHPSDLFNLGRVREEQGDLEAALAHYEAFAEQPRLTLEQRDAAAERIEVLRKIVRPPPTEPAPGSTAPPPSRSDADDAPRSPARPLLISGAVLTGVGALMAVGGGVGFGLVARRNTEQLDHLSMGQNPSRLTLSETEELHAQGRNAEALQITFLAAGSAVALLGVGLAVAGIRARKRDQRASITPSVGPGFAGVSSRWNF